MTYRNGSYIAFHAGGTADPTASDIKYYRMLKAWHEHSKIEFSFVNSHEKAASVRDSSKRETLRASLRQRLNNSKNFVLIIGETTKSDTDWVPFEIEYAVDSCGLPIIATYTGYESVLNPSGLSHLWPDALAKRINSGVAKVIHIPFKQRLIDDAIVRFDLNNKPNGSLVYFTADWHRKMGIDI